MSGSSKQEAPLLAAGRKSRENPCNLIKGAIKKWWEKNPTGLGLA